MIGRAVTLKDFNFARDWWSRKVWLSRRLVIGRGEGRWGERESGKGNFGA